MSGKNVKPPEAEKKSKPGNIFDAFVKSMFGRIFIFADFLKNYADPKFLVEIDLRKIKPAPTHYFGKDGDERIVDLVFQCPLKNGDGSMLAVIIFEHKSGNLRHIPRKLMKYLSAIWEAEAKEGKKILSAPYFLVLRTARRPHRGRYPLLTDVLPKAANGQSVGHVPEIAYDVVDLPACDFAKLRGGPELRLVLGILKKMVEGDGSDFPEALLPLLEIENEGQKVELTKELLEFVAKAMAAHNRRLDEEMVHKALKPVFQNREKAMIKTIFEEREEIGEARGKAATVVKILAKNFGQVPKRLSDQVLQIGDAVVLDSLTELALDCQSLDDFAAALK